MRDLMLAGMLSLVLAPGTPGSTNGIAAVTFRATDYAFAGPDTIAAGVTAPVLDPHSRPRITSSPIRPFEAAQASSRSRNALHSAKENAWLHVLSNVA